MDKADVEFTVGLDTSPAERQLDILYERMTGVRRVSSIETDRSTQPRSIIPTPPRDILTANAHRETNLPATTITRELARIAQVFQRQSQGIPGWRYAGSSTWNEQKKIGYDNLPATSANRMFQDAINFSFINRQQKWRYAGSSYARSAYDDFEDINNGGVPPKGPPIDPSTDGNKEPEDKKDLVQKNKKDNEELKEKSRLWLKIAGTIYAIRKILQGLAKVWKFGAETITGVNSNINEESGYFSTDPEGALRANTDKTRSVLYAGIRNMGNNAPVSKQGLDYATNKITDMWTKAVTGQSVDTQTAIDAQRLKDFFGIDATVAGLLTGKREGKTATDIQIDIMDKVESQLSKLANADEITKGQVTESLKNILGPELIDAIVANANKNKKIDDPNLRLSLAELLMSHGDSAIPAGKLTEATAGTVNSISELKDSFQQLKNTLLTELAPAIISIVDTITAGVNWINKKLNKTDGEKNALGEAKSKVSVTSLTDDKLSRWKNIKQGKEDTKDKYGDKGKITSDALSSKDPLKILDALYLSQPEAETAADIENLAIKQQEMVVGDALKAKRFDPNSKSPIIRELAKHKYKSYTGYQAFAMELANEEGLGWDSEDVRRLFSADINDMSEFEMLEAMRNFVKNNRDVRDAFSNAFDEKKGGELDFGTTMDVFKYLYSIKNFSSEQDRYDALQALADESLKVMDNTVNLTPTWTDKNKNGKIDLGEVGLTLVVKNQYGEVMMRKDISAELQ